MNARKKDLWLKRSANNLLYVYLLMMIAVFIYASFNVDEFTFQEESLYSNEVYILMPNGNIVYPVETYSASELNDIYWSYFFYYLFNATLLLLTIWFIPEKRKKIAKFEEKIKGLIK